MVDLPPVIATYFNCPPDADVDTLLTIFTPGAHVQDEKHDYEGIEAIRAWRVDTHARTPFTVKPLELHDRDGTLIVSAEVSGAFPNSPVLLDHKFTLADGRIATLDIG